jgi:hypothetical protein
VYKELVKAADRRQFTLDGTAFAALAVPFRGETAHVSITNLCPGLDILAEQITLKKFQVAAVVTASVRRVVLFTA